MGIERCVCIIEVEGVRVLLCVVCGRATAWVCVMRCAYVTTSVCVAGFLVSNIGGFIQQGVRSSGEYQPVCASCVWPCVCVARVWVKLWCQNLGVLVVLVRMVEVGYGMVQLGVRWKQGGKLCLRVCVWGCW